jgi:hypothetical protein
MANPILKFVRSVCVQSAVYWGNPIADGFGGKAYTDIREIKVRWDDKQELIKDKEGKEVMSCAEITVIEDLSLDGVLRLGTFDDIADSTGTVPPPEEVGDVYTILQVEKTPLFRSSTEFVRRVWV